MLKREQIETIIDKEIRPTLRQHGGDILIKSYDGNSLQLTFTGACRACPSAQITTEEIVKVALKGIVENVSIVNETDEELLNLAKSILNKKNS